MKPTEEQIKQLMEYVIQAVEFGKEQAPLLAEEMVSYGIFRHLLLIFVFMSFLAMGLWFLRRAWKIPTEGVCHYWPDNKIAFSIVGLPSSLLGFLGVVPNALWLGMAIMSPRLYILKELKSLL